ncbi:Uncharacterized protein TCM_042969 [Theobroma cacao]|uniref:Uncharacterized protein n=1 Tax=Theobroma cacao TaxID=3641 RepID=A0A061FUA4_THECC|nr:Uncharacterized protein TCM_042969 [Theobroma cacao]
MNSHSKVSSLAFMFCYIEPALCSFEMYIVTEVYHATFCCSYLLTYSITPNYVCYNTIKLQITKLIQIGL